jgi:hypothetical protein
LNDAQVVVLLVFKASGFGTMPLTWGAFFVGALVDKMYKRRH